MKFVTERDPTEKRACKCDGPKELVLSEPAVMLAVAQWMFKRGAVRVCIYPDGQHLKQFDIARWLKCQRFRREESEGKSGVWVCDGRTLEVRVKSGEGDVVADVDGKCNFVETKGGCINSRDSGLLSHLRRRLYEAVGSLFVAPKGTRRLAAVPRHRETEKLACRMADRCRRAGIQVMLVSRDGEIELVPKDSDANALLKASRGCWRWLHTGLIERLRSGGITQIWQWPPRGVVPRRNNQERDPSWKRPGRRC